MELLVGEAVRLRILELCDKNNITINKLGTICGITQSTLNNIVSGRNTANTSTIKKICDGLNMQIEEFWACDLFRNLEPEVR